MNPRPFSLHRRFLLMQAGSALLALWLIAGAAYIGDQIRGRLEQSLQELHASLSLNQQVHSAFQEWALSFWRTYYPNGESQRAQYDAAGSRLRQLTSQYVRTSSSAAFQNQMEFLGRKEEELLQLTDRLLVQKNVKAAGAGEIREVQDLQHQIDQALSEIAVSQLQNLHDSTGRLRRYTMGLYVVLLATAGFTLLVTGLFRRVHRRELWEPIEGLRRMVLEIRRGNLKVSGAMPRSLELRPLMEALENMAAELAEMRGSLEQKVLERTAELKAAQSQLFQAAKLSSLGQLVSGVAHEINNPLTSILGFTEILLGRPELNATAHNQLQTIRDECLRLRNLVANLSSFARRAPQRTEPVDLCQILNRLVELRRYQLSASGIELRYDASSDPIWVEGDPDQLLQVFFNLVLNAEQAIKSFREKGDIRVSCGQKEARAWAMVEDNGSGIAEETLKHIFDPFFTTKPVGKGTGLGLSISHGIIRQHHGDIRVDSQEGAGTRVSIWLPTRRTSASAAPPAPAKTAAAPADPPPAARLLVIDDEPTITSLVAAAVQKQNYQVTVLNDSTALEAALEQANFDLVICDLKMPGKNGLEILKLIRQKRPELSRRFLLMTGNLAEAEQNDVELADVPILRKPFTLPQLREAIQGVMKKV